MYIALENKGFSDFLPVIFGMEKCKPSHNYGPSIRSYYLIHYVVSGSGTLYSPRGTYSVKKGQAFLIKPEEINTYTADSSCPWEYIWIGFNGKLCEKFKTLPDVFEIDSTLFLEMTVVFRFKSGVEEYLTGMLFKLYYELFGDNFGTDYVKKVSNFINTNYMNEVSISKIAKSLNIDRKYLSRIFKEQMGISPKEYLIEKRMSAAKKLLKTGYSVCITAQMTGYSDAFVFSKAFKKMYGKSPIEYKSK